MLIRVIAFRTGSLGQRQVPFFFLGGAPGRPDREPQGTERVSIVLTGGREPFSLLVALQGLLQFTGRSAINVAEVNVPPPQFFLCRTDILVGASERNRANQKGHNGKSPGSDARRKHSDAHNHSARRQGADVRNIQFHHARAPAMSPVRLYLTAKSAWICAPRFREMHACQFPEPDAAATVDSPGVPKVCRCSCAGRGYGLNQIPSGSASPISALRPTSITSATEPATWKRPRFLSAR